MGNFDDEKAWLKKAAKTFVAGASAAPKTESTQRPASPPPAYQTVVPSAMPRNPMALVERDDTEDFDDGHQVVKHSGRKENDRSRRPRDDQDDDRHGASRHRIRDASVDSRDGARDQHIVKRSKSSKPMRGADRSESDAESDHKSKRERKNMELVKHSRSSKHKRQDDLSDLESESDQKSKSKSKRKEKRKESKALVKHKSNKKHKESEPESDSNEEVVERRQRFEEIEYEELSRDYRRAIEHAWQCLPDKVRRWCDEKLIRLDTRDGSYNADKLLKKKPLDSSAEEAEWAKFEKRYKRWIAENPGGDMSNIPRFNKGGDGHSSHAIGGHRRVPDVIVVDRPVFMGRPNLRPYYDPSCFACFAYRGYCGNPSH